MKKGSLLFDLLIGLVIVSSIILLVFSLRSFNYKGMCFNELHLLKAVIQKAQMKAIALSVDQSILIDLHNSAYHYDNSVIRFEHLLIRSSLNDLQQLDQAISFARNTIVCFASGVISAGTLYFIDKEKTYSFALSCPVGQVSRINIYEYSDRWILLNDF